MDLIIGGAYQGKLAYAKAKYKVQDSEVYTCTENERPALDHRCIRHLETYVLYCLRNGVEPETDFKTDAVLIARDISAGVVPIDAETRAWREAVGRYLNALAAKAEHVTRIFCGLPMELK